MSEGAPIRWDRPAAALGSAPRVHESVLFESRQDQLQKLLRNLLPLGNVCNLHRTRWSAPRHGKRLRRQIEYRLQGVFALNRDIHPVSNTILIRVASILIGIVG